MPNDIDKYSDDDVCKISHHHLMSVSTRNTQHTKYPKLLYNLEFTGEYQMNQNLPWWALKIDGDPMDIYLYG